MADIKDVQNFSYRGTCTTHPFNTSDTASVKSRVAGVKGWTATVTALAQTLDTPGPHAPACEKGNTGTLTLYTLSTTNYFSGAAICTGCDVNVDVLTGAPSSYTYSFRGTAAAGHTGSGTAVLSSTGCNVDWT